MFFFLLIAIAGLVLLAASVIIGEIFDFFSFEIGDIDFGGDSGGPITTPAISLGLTAFGATGMLTQWAGWGVFLSVTTSFFSAIAFAALGAWLAVVLYRQTAGTDDAFVSLTGRVGEVVTSITSSPGEVQFSSYGSTHTRLARSVSGDQIPSGTLVRVVDILGNSLIVERLDESSTESEVESRARA